jgi:hypothetical protein
VSAFSLEGEFVRRRNGRVPVSVGKPSRLHDVACSAFDELVVASSDNSSSLSRVAVFRSSVEQLKTMGVAPSRDI